MKITARTPKRQVQGVQVLCKGTQLQPIDDLWQQRCAGALYGFRVLFIGTQIKGVQVLCKGTQV